MPIHEYQCEKCSHCFEKLTFQGDREAVRCPNCDDEAVKQLMSCVSFFGERGVGACAADAPKGFS